MKQSLCFIGMILSSLAIAPLANAQIIPDQTLPINSSVVSGCKICTITGGTDRGVNLYHSFREFSIPTGGAAFFNNAPQIQTILTRVTGNSLSNLDGLIKANGSANVFLLNPNGILFGPNATLDIGGSFLATTANQFKFSDGSTFSAVTPQAPPLLTINLVPGLQVGSIAPRSPLTNAGTLAVPSGKTLTLLGGTTTNTGRLIAPGGTVQVLGDRVGLLGTARVDVSSAIGGGTVLVGGDAHGQGLVPKARQTIVGAQVSIVADSLQNGHGGKVVVWANDTTRFYGTIRARGAGPSGKGGWVEVSGAKNLIFNGFVNTSAPFGPAGTLLLDPTNITVVPGASPDPINLTTDSIWSIAEDPGDQEIGADVIRDLLATTDVTLEASNSIVVTSSILADSLNTLTLNAQTIEVYDALISQSGGGDIRINASGELRVSSLTPFQGGIRSNTYGTSNAGNLWIDAANVVFQGNVIVSSNVENGGDASGGLIDIQANSLSILDGAQVQAILRGEDANGPAGRGSVGVININVSDRVLVSGWNTINGRFSDSRIASDIGIRSVSNEVSRDVININAKSIVLENTATIATTTYSFGAGDAGNINLKADDVTIDNATLRSNIEPNAVGKGGNVNIQAQNALIMKNGGVINLDSQGFGDAGSLDVRAGSLTVSDAAQVDATTGGEGNAGRVALTVEGDAIFRDSFSGVFSTVSAGAIGSSGEIEVTAGSLFVQDGAQLLTTTEGIGNAGDITISVRDRVVLSGILDSGETTIGSDVVDQSPGNSGDISINARSVELNNDAIVAASLLEGGRIDEIPAQAGKVTIVASERILADQSRIFSEVGFDTLGNGGLISLTAPLIKLTNGAKLDTSTAGQGTAGNIILNANSFEALTGSQVQTTTFTEYQAGDIELNARDRLTLADQNTGLLADTGLDSTGKGGNIKVNAGVVQIQDGAGIVVDSNGLGTGGSITLQASQLTLQQGFMTAETASAQGGNIQLDVDKLVLLRRGSLISASAGTAESVGDGGNITINSPFVIGILTENSDIRANAFTGKGGNITINANQVFGLLPQPRDTRFSDITASSAIGINGTITLNTLTIDPSRGLQAIDLTPQDPANRVSQTCQGHQRVTEGENRFVIVGRGGLSGSPDEPFGGIPSLTDLGNPLKNAVTAAPVSTQFSTQSVTAQVADPIAIEEAQSIVRDRDGVIYLVAPSSMLKGGQIKGVQITGVQRSEMRSPSIQCQALK